MLEEKYVKVIPKLLKQLEGRTSEVDIAVHLYDTDIIVHETSLLKALYRLWRAINFPQPENEGPEYEIITIGSPNKRAISTDENNSISQSDMYND